MNIAYLIVSIISLIVAVVFFSWGAYQIRTGKMVARFTVDPIDEPREVGMLFVAISVLAFWLTYLFAMMFFFPVVPPAISAITDVFGTLVVILLPLAAIIVAGLGIRDQRIFGIKSLPKIKKLIKKYYLLVDISTIILAAVLCVFFLFGGSFSPSLNMIFFIVSAILIFFPMIPLMVISRANKKS